MYRLGWFTAYVAKLYNVFLSKDQGRFELENHVIALIVPMLHEPCIEKPGTVGSIPDNLSFLIEHLLFENFYFLVFFLPITVMLKILF